jgi:hypothetical protein
MESSGIEGGNNILSSGGDNKLNLNKGSDAGEKSGRELLSKNEKTEEEPNSYKKSHESENVETKKSKNEENNENERKTKTKKEEEKEKEEDTNDAEKDQKDKGKKKKKEKLSIIPYKVSASYQGDLIQSLKKDSKLRPKTLLAPDFDDITRDIGELDEEEKQKNMQEKLEDMNVEEKEREDKTFLNKYKESSMSGNTFLQDPMALFSGAQKAYIDQFYQLSDLFVICPLYFNYRISLEYCTSQNQEAKGKGGKKEFTAYHLFNTKEISPACSHNCLSNQSRPININVFNFIVDSKESDRKIQRFLSIKKNFRCALSCLCACCSRPTFIVETPIEQLGSIIELRTACDPVLNVCDINKDIIYVIKASCTDCGYCCRDQCCDDRRCATCKFSIYDGLQENELGTIEKDHRSGKKVKPDYDQLVVTFPESASCQDRVLLTCSAIAIEYLYFQSMSNTKRCSGEPQFRNAFSK